MEALIDFKQELEYVDAVGVYNLSEQEYSFLDSNMSELDPIKSMTLSNCFDGTEFLYLQIDDHDYFVRKHDIHLLILKMKTLENVNRVILEHKVLQLIKEL